MPNNNRTLETIKTIALAAIIAGVFSFVQGVNYEQRQTAKTASAVRDALRTAPAVQAPPVAAATSK